MVLTEAHITAVLLALWQQPQTTLAHLAAATGLPLPLVASALAALASRRCILEQTPTSVMLVRTGLYCWRDILEHRAARKPLGRTTLVFQTTGSTNDICWAAAKDPAAHDLVVLADQQSAGRGRRGNAWLANPGQSILLSILLRNHPGLPETLTLLLGLAAAEAIEAVAHLDTEIKWPNDVLVGGPKGWRKTCGVLVEQRGRHVVLGLGLNVAQAASDFPAELRTRATSLYAATGRQFDRLSLIVALLERIEARCLADMPADTWLPAWRSRCPLLGQTLELRTANRKVRGRVIDIDPRHGLVLRTDHGGTTFCSAATSTLSVA